MKWNIFYKLRGPVGDMEVPNSPNPIECENLASVLARLSQNLPAIHPQIEVTGLRIEKVE